MLQRTPIAFALLSTLALAAACTPPERAATESSEREAQVCGVGPELEGIDVSYWQPNIDWNAVAGDGIVYAFIRVSDGDPAAGGTYDTDFQTNWAGAQAAGVIRGVYQFFRPNHDPIAQADLLIHEIGGAMTPGDLPPVIDVEATGGLSPSGVAAAIQTWIDHIEAQLGVTPIIYSGKYFWQDNVQSTAFNTYPLWHAQYPGFTPLPCPNIADQWSSWAFWQYTSSGSVAGIGGNVDRNIFNGDIDALSALLFGDPLCGDGFCSPGEDHATCPADCPVCENIPAAGRIVDDTDLCFEERGTPAYWRYEGVGHGDTLLWTHTVDMTEQMDNHAVWQLTFDVAGDYRIEAYTDAAFAESQTALYQVHHAGNTDVISVDQTAVDGWALVGEFYFAAGGDQWVRLEDQTGEPLSTQTAIVFDAVRVTNLSPPIFPDAGVGADAGGPGADGGVGGDDAGTDPDDPGGGCGCRSGNGGAPVGILVGLLVFVLVRRRRG